MSNGDVSPCLQYLTFVSGLCAPGLLAERGFDCFMEKETTLMSKRSDGCSQGEVTLFLQTILHLQPHRDLLPISISGTVGEKLETGHFTSF